MKVLVACEESQAVCIAFRELGHEAYSADIQDCSGGHPEWHIKGDVLSILDDGWDLMIAHPPCTYLSNAGAVRLYPKKGQINKERYLMGLDGKDFFIKLLKAPIKKIAIENPTPSKIFGLPKESQVIQPFQFGHPYSKRTLLWLVGLPLLVPTNILDEYEPFISSNTGGKKRGQKYHIGIAKSAKHRSKTFDGIARAMAEQWGSL